MNATAKHTAGPWEFIPRDETPGHREPAMIKIGAAMWELARGYENAEVDGRLMAAAPVMLEALQAALLGIDIFLGRTGDVSGVEPQRKALAAAGNMVEAAIAAAQVSA